MARPSRQSGNLPAETTSFIGRRRELTELRKKLTEARLVSLVGPGGVGKTRLAIRIATDLGRGFRHGAWLADLAEVRDAALVGNAVIAALDLRDQAATEPLALLLSYLQDKQLLLVVDNCEHILGAAARLLTEVLGAAPGVRVVATSREPLSVAGEHVVPVPPLELPSVHDEALAQLRHNEAVMLFTERAAAASGAFALTAANQAAVVDLCRRLDGLPLAIELAAVRTRVLTVEQICDRLTDRFALLTGGSRAALRRHQTLRTTIDWSHELLGSEERTLLRRLSVFAGRFHARRRRVRMHVRRCTGCPYIGPAVIVGRQIPGDERGGKGPRLLSPPRGDARICWPQVARGWRGGSRRRTMRRVLPSEVFARHRGRSLSAGRVARVDESGDRQRPIRPAAMPD